MSISVGSSIGLNPKVFNVVNKTPKSKLFRIILPFIIIISLFFAISILKFNSSNDNNPLTGRIIKVNSSKPTKLNGGSNTSNTVSAKQVLSSQSIVQPEIIPSCSSVTKPQFSAPLVDVNNPGVFIGDPITAYYQIYGNNKDQIYNQMNICSPVIINGEQYAASTNYSISWVFNSSVNEQGLCKVKNVSVGLRNAFIFPSWQKTTSSSNQISSSWNNFIIHLTEHEYGHARLNQEYAYKIHSEIQNTPITECSNINEFAHSRALVVLENLDNANKNYDSNTNHGEHEGAVL